MRRNNWMKAIAAFFTLVQGGFSFLFLVSPIFNPSEPVRRVRVQRVIRN